MSGAAIIWVLICGLTGAMLLLVVCRGHWYALLDVMHRLGPDALIQLDWPREHPFDVPDPNTPDARKFPVRRTRARVLLFGLPAPHLCPPAARQYARRFRLWAVLFLAVLAGAAVVLVSPAILGILGVLGVVQYLMTPRWPHIKELT